MFKKDLSELKDKILELNREVQENQRIKDRELKQLMHKHEQQIE